MTMASVGFWQIRQKDRIVNKPTISSLLCGEACCIRNKCVQWPKAKACLARLISFEARLGGYPESYTEKKMEQRVRKPRSWWIIIGGHCQQQWNANVTNPRFLSLLSFHSASEIVQHEVSTLIAFTTPVLINYLASEVEVAVLVAVASEVEVVVVEAVVVQVSRLTNISFCVFFPIFRVGLVLALQVSIR